MISELAFYVNEKGFRSRQTEIAWPTPITHLGKFNLPRLLTEDHLCSSLPFVLLLSSISLTPICLYFVLAYSAPHVVVYSERGIDIFNTSTAEWLQTLSIRRVYFKAIILLSSSGHTSLALLV